LIFHTSKSKPLTFPMKIKDFIGTGPKFPTGFGKFLTGFAHYAFEKEQVINKTVISLSIIDHIYYIYKSKCMGFL
jgi:hypothetical protein